MRLLLLHQNYPGQFAHLAAAASSAGWDVVGIGARPEPQRPVPGAYRASGGDPVKACRHPDPAPVVQAQLAQGQRVRQQLQQLRHSRMSLQMNTNCLSQRVSDQPNTLSYSSV